MGECVVGFEGIDYETSSLREEVEKQFKIVCKKELVELQKLIEISASVNSYLADIEESNNSMEYYTRLINARIRDRFVAATLLIGKGFTVDGITLIRSALEDLWIIQNLYYKDDFMSEWENGKKVYPFELRNLKEIEDRKDINDTVYASLCDISHCRINSLDHMVRFHPSVKGGGNEGIKRVKMYPLSRTI